MQRNRGIHQLSTYFDSHRLAAFLLLAVVYFVLCLLLFPFDSPLGKVAATDNGIYMVIGRGWVHGALPYRDLFDQKGPFTFLVNSLGFRITDSRLGPFLVCSVIVFISLAMEWHFLQKRNRQTAITACLLTAFGVWLFAFCLNIPEVHVLPCTVYPVYAVYRWLTDQDGNVQVKLRPLSVFLIGICFGIALMTKATNGMVILGVCLFLAIAYCRQHWFADLFKSILLFLAGTGVVFGVFSAYFAWHGAFDDFIYGTFLFNFLYTNRRMDGFGIFGANAQYAVLFVVVLGYLIHFWRKEGKNSYTAFFACTTITAIIGQSLGNVVAHYVACNVPLYALMIALAIERWKAAGGSKKTCAAVVLLFAFSFGYDFALDGWRVLTYAKWSESIYQASEESKEFIYENNLEDSVLAYNTEADVYLIGDLVPAWKHFTLQDFHAIFDPSITEQFKEVLHQRTIRCIILPSGHLDDPETDALLQSNYSLAHVSTGENYRGDLRTQYIFVLK